MKKILKFVPLFITTILIFLALNIYADGPPDPPPHGGDKPPVGGGAPIGSGLVVLLVLGSAYGVKKFYDYKKKELLD